MTSAQFVSRVRTQESASERQRLLSIRPDCVDWALRSLLNLVQKFLYCIVVRATVLEDPVLRNSVELLHSGAAVVAIASKLLLISVESFHWRRIRQPGPSKESSSKGDRATRQPEPHPFLFPKTHHRTNCPTHLVSEISRCQESEEYY